MGEVQLHGTWRSAFSYRVILALKLKGVPFKYIEEDLQNKSPLLLRYNPVHKKIPVLVHGGKPVCESMVIVEYIDEVWPEKPLLPSSPHERATARFWIKFLEDKAISFWRTFRAKGEQLEAAKKDSLEILKTMEEHVPGGTRFFMGDEIGMVDIAFGSIGYWLEVNEKVLGVKLFEAHEFPKLAALINNFKEEPVIKENLPDQHKMFVFFKGRREKLMA